MGFLDKVTDVASKMGNKMVQAPNSEASGIREKKENVDRYMDAVSAKPADVKATPANTNVDKINPKAKYGDRPGEKRPGPDGMPVYHKGTENVPHTGPAMLKKGEAVVPAEKNPMNPDNMYDLVKKPKKSKKEIEHMKVRKAKSGGHIVEHHHTNPSDHKMEEHVMPDMAALHSHMDKYMNNAPVQGASAEEPASGAEDEGRAVGA